MRKKSSLILILAVSVFIAGTAMVQAVESSSGGISGYIDNFYNTAIILGGVAAILVIIIGGLMWATSGAIDQKNMGRDLITSAIWGLVLLLGAYIILNTINPELTDLSEPGGVGEGIAGLGTGVLVTDDPYSCLLQPELNPCLEGKATDESNLTEEGGLTCCNPVVKCVGVQDCTPPLTGELAPDESAELECKKSDGTTREGYYPVCASIAGLSTIKPYCLKEGSLTVLPKNVSCSGGDPDLKPMCLRTSPTAYRIVCAKEETGSLQAVPDCKGDTCKDAIITTTVTIYLGGTWGGAAYYPENNTDKSGAQCVNYVYREWGFTDWKYADLEGLKPCP